VSEFAAGYAAAAHAFVSALDDHVTLEGSLGHHLARVRRLRSGEVVTLADSQGRWRPYTVVVARGDAVRLDARGDAVTEPHLEPGLAVAFALTKGAKRELTVQKLTELGVDRIVPLQSRRSVPRWGADRATAAVERLRRVAVESAAQSRRARLPQVEPLKPLADVEDHPGLVLADRDGDDAESVPPPQDGEWMLVVGPEGGLGPDEAAALGPSARLRVARHVLRAETAAIAGAALLTTRRAIGDDRK
jgi:16S rRNA (uracil1498-N3)-methyltransferase